MKKKDLKDWMLVQTRDFGIFMHVGGELFNQTNWNDLVDYHDDLDIDTDLDEGFDIVKVSRVLESGLRPPYNWTEETLDANLLWEREAEKAKSYRFEKGDVEGFISALMEHGALLRGSNGDFYKAEFDLYTGSFFRAEVDSDLQEFHKYEWFTKVPEPWPDKCAIRFRDNNDSRWHLGFWNAKHRRPFSSFGGRNGASAWEIIERLEEEPGYLTEMRPKLED